MFSVSGSKNLTHTQRNETLEGRREEDDKWYGRADEEVKFKEERKRDAWFCIKVVRESIRNDAGYGDFGSLNGVL